MGGHGMRIIRDSREKHPFNYSGKRYEDVEVVESTLNVGDYSLAGLTDKIAVERKELGDLWGYSMKGKSQS